MKKTKYTKNSSRILFKTMKKLVENILYLRQLIHDDFLLQQLPMLIGMVP